jgi:hypothetical protein
MKKAIGWLILGAFVLSACGQVPSSTPPCANLPRATRPAGTFTRPRSTATWTPFPTDTLTPVPSPSASPTPSKGLLRQKFLDGLTKTVQAAPGVGKVNLVRATSDGISINLDTNSALSYQQPPVSFAVVQALAQAYAAQKKGDLTATLESTDFLIYLVTTSSKGVYRYGSITDWNTLVGLAKGQLTYDNWVQAAGASFKP